MSNLNHHKKTALGGRAVYQYRQRLSGGMDLSLYAKAGGGNKAAILDNLYRDKTRPYEAVETFPGYRRLIEVYGKEGEAVNGIFYHVFKDGIYIYLHRGQYLYTFAHAERDAAVPYRLTHVEDAPSRGVSFGGRFYFFDGKTILRFSEPKVFAPWGDGDQTDETEDLNELPETDAYIPLISKNGEAYEARNLLTNYYRVKDRTVKARRVYDDFGLHVRVIPAESPYLEVTGVDDGRRVLYIPNEMRYRGTLYPVQSIAYEAFAESDIEVAVLSENIKLLPTSFEKKGVFYHCEKLRRVALYGVETIEDNTFALCENLEEVMLAGSVESIALDAFYGTVSLHTVYYGGAALPPHEFSSAVTVYSDCYLGTLSVGEDLRIVIDPDLHKHVYRMKASEAGVFSDFKRYGGWESGVYGDADGYMAVAKSPCLLYGVCFETYLENTPRRYGFFTVVGKGAFIKEGEDPIASYRIPIADRCRQLCEVKIDAEGASYEAEIAYGEESYRIESLLVRLPFADTVEVALTLYGHPARVAAIERYYPDCTMQAMEAIRSADLAAVAEDRLYLATGALPGILFYTVYPKGTSEDAYLSTESVLYVGEGAIKGLLPLSSGFAALGEKSIVLCREDRVISSLTGVSSVGDSLTYHDKRYLLLSDGVYRLKEGATLEYSSLEKLSHPIDAAVCDYQKTSLALWNGYLVLLAGNTAYLSDLDSEYREESHTLHPWYRLTSLGHAVGARTVYRHASVNRTGVSDIGGRALSVLGREERVTGEVFSAEADGILLFYTDEGGKRYLVTTDGEVEGGELFPFSHMLSVDGFLYFEATDGSLFGVNTDRRLNGEIPNEYYHYDHRRITSRIVSEFADMGCEYLNKRTEAKSFVLDYVGLPYGAVTVSSEDNRGRRVSLGRVSLGSLLGGVDFGNLSFDGTLFSQLMLDDPLHRFAKKRIVIASSGYLAPISVVSFAYRYRVEKRWRQ